MILNGHVKCAHGVGLTCLLNHIVKTSSSKNNHAYSTSLANHVWTFDDALADQLQIYIDHFAPQRLVFQMFVCPRLIDEWEIGNIEYVRRQLGNPTANLLRWDEIGRLVDSGNILGSHGIDHSSFLGMSRDQVIEQLERSREMLKNRTGHIVNSFAFPFGAVGHSSLETSLFARNWYNEVHLSDNSLPVGELADGVFNRRHAEYGICAARGIMIGALNVLLGVRRWRS